MFVIILCSTVGMALEIKIFMLKSLLLINTSYTMNRWISHCCVKELRLEHNYTLMEWSLIISLLTRSWIMVKFFLYVEEYIEYRLFHCDCAKVYIHIMVMVVHRLNIISTVGKTFWLKFRSLHMIAHNTESSNQCIDN